MKAVLIAFASLALPTLAHADIYKCVDASVIAYQSRPCASGQKQTVMSVDKRPAVQIASASPASRTVNATSGRDVVFRRTTLALGMSDDEVLNLRGWGVPSHIDRSRDGRVPMEAWRYDRPDGNASWLYFTNARLTAMGGGSSAADRIGYTALR